MTTVQLPEAAPIEQVRVVAWQIRGWLNTPGMRVYRLDAEGVSIRVIDVRMRKGVLETREPDGGPEAPDWVAATPADRYYETV